MSRPFRPVQSSRAARPAVRQRHRQAVAASAVSAAVLAALYGAQGRADPAADAGDTGALQEVVVTATRRAVTAQDLPISITAISGNTLDQAGIQDIAGLAQSVAGITYTDRGPFGGINGSTLVIRGLNSESLAFQEGLATPVVPPVATYVDDTPLFFNLRLDDLQRVEILRGPQGTLYGSGSLGGTMRFVQNAPDPSGFDAKVEAGISDTAHTQAPNEKIFGMVNLPLSDTLALRINGGASNDAGFINQTNIFRLNPEGAPILSQPATPSNPVGLNPQIPPEIYGQKGVNSYQYRNARISMLWQPNEDLKSQLSYYYQQASANGFPYIATGPLGYTLPISPYNQPTPTGTIPGPSNPPTIPQLYPGVVPPGTDRLTSPLNSLEGTRDEVNLLALNVDYNFGFATLTSATSFAHHVNSSHSDLTAEYENFYFYQNLYGQNPLHFIQTQDGLNDKVFAQEFRLASKTGNTLDWVGGLFFKDQKTDIQEHEFYPGYNAFYNACVAAGGTLSDLGGTNASQCGAGEYGPLTGTSSYLGIPLTLDQAYIGDFQTTYKDFALFGELTWHITSAWSVTGGGRVFKQTIDQSQQTGLLFDGPGFIANDSGNDVFRRATWKLNTAYQFDPNNLAYATWSQGFRRGGINAIPLVQISPGRPGTECPPGTPNVPGTTSPPGYCGSPSLLQLQPDTVDNYEIGYKGTYAHRINFSAALFDMEWHNVQEGTSLTPLSLPASANIGEAYSRGLELQINANLTNHISAQLGYTYDQTKITSFDQVFVLNSSATVPAAGGPLPGAPKTSLSAGLEYGRIELLGGQMRVAADAHYQSVVLPSISETVNTVPGYTMTNALIGWQKSNWMLTVYCNNLFNVLGVNAQTDSYFYGNRTTDVISQPRTLGLTVGYSFKGY